MDDDKKQRWLDGLKDGDQVAIEYSGGQAHLDRIYKGVCRGKTAGGKIRIQEDRNGETELYKANGSRSTGSGFACRYFRLIEVTPEIAKAWQEQAKSEQAERELQTERGRAISDLAPVPMALVLRLRENVMGDIRRYRDELGARAAGASRDLARVMEACKDGSLTMHDHRINSCGVLQSNGGDIDRLSPLLHQAMRFLEEIDAYLLGDRDDVEPFIVRLPK